MAFTSTQQIVVDLFIAAYGRSPTKSGLDFFVSQLDSGQMSVEDISDFMLDTTNNKEAKTRYPDNMSTSEKVEIVFHNILGRGTATKEGLDFWVNRVDNEENYSMSDLMREILNSARDNSVDAQILDNKSSVAEYFLIHIPIDKQSGNQPYLDNIIDTDSVEDAKKDIDKILTVSFDNKSYINNGLGELSTNQTEGVSSIDSTTHWDKDELTFSFNNTIPDSYYSYPNEELSNNWSALNETQKNTVRSITSEINNLLDIKLTEVKDNGDIRFNIIDMEENTAGFSFYPTENPDYGGDVFLSSAFNSDPDNYGLEKGDGGWVTITHELGHTLGLKHPFEEPNKLPTITDDINHTVMSYTAKEDIVPKFTLDGLTIKLEYHILYPDLYSLYDVSALQAIYGVNDNYHTEDNIYTTSYTNYQIQTIWDAGGKDTIDLSNTKGDTTIDLNGGTLNSVDEYSLEDIITLHQDGVTNRELRDWIRDKVTQLYNEDLLYTGKNNFGITEGVIIEDIKTGSGDDIVKDNLVDNIIATGAGDDKVYIGQGGYDHIDGGEGSDSLYLNILQSQTELKQIDNETYSIMAEDFYVELTNIETVYFIDSSSIQI